MFRLKPEHKTQNPKQNLVIMKNLTLFITMILTAVTAATFSQPIFSTFDDYNDNPVLSPGVSQSWDGDYIHDPRVIEFEGTYYTFYTGIPENGPGVPIPPPQHRSG